MKPEFVDNRSGNTLKAALVGHLEHRLATGQPPAEVCIASAYFNPAGFFQVAEQLERVPKVRLLLGAEPSPESGLARTKNRSTHPNPSSAAEGYATVFTGWKQPFARSETSWPFQW